jgi:hypothetical protein
MTFDMVRLSAQNCARMGQPMKSRRPAGCLARHNRAHNRIAQEEARGSYCLAVTGQIDINGTNARL